MSAARTADTITTDEILSLARDGDVSFVVGWNALGPDGSATREARAECAKTWNAKHPTCSRCGAFVERSWDHLDIGEHGERWTCV